MSTPQSWSGGGRRQVDEVRWSRKVTEMGQGIDKDEKGKKGGHTMTSPPSYATMSQSGVALLRCQGWHEVVRVEGEEECGELGCQRWNSSTTAGAWTPEWGSHMLSECDQSMNLTRYHNLPHLNLESRTSSTSYSSGALMRLVPGCGGCVCLAMSPVMYGVIVQTDTTRR